MTFPKPVPGLVLRYGFLWSHEAERGQQESSKDRPAAILMTTAIQGGRTVVMTLPITHTPPAFERDAVEIPSTTKRRLGLDGERSWIVVTEMNRFVWPGPDLRFAIPGDPESVVYGPMPRGLHDRVREAWLAAYDRGAVRTIDRTS